MTQLRRPGAMLTRILLKKSLAHAHVVPFELEILLRCECRRADGLQPDVSKVMPPRAGRPEGTYKYGKSTILVTCQQIRGRG